MFAYQGQIQHQQILLWNCWNCLTCLQSEASRLRLLVEMVRLIVMPANCRLLFPRIVVRQREEGCRGEGCGLRVVNKPGAEMEKGFFKKLKQGMTVFGVLYACAWACWVYVWKCLCVWEWKNSCNCESDPVYKPRPTVTDGKWTGQFTYCRLGSEHHTEHASTTVPAHLSQSSSCSHGFHPYLLQNSWGMLWKKHHDRMHMLSHINLSPANSETLD